MVGFKLALFSGSFHEVTKKTEFLELYQMESDKYDIFNVIFLCMMNLSRTKYIYQKFSG